MTVGSQKPRVIHVYKDFWPPILGGIERSINWMVDGLRDEFDFTILVNSRTKETRRREWEGIPIIEVGEWGRFSSAPLSPSFPFHLKKLKADIWHFHIPNPTGDVSALLARPRGAVVATYHSDIVRQSWAMGIYGPFLNRFLKQCDIIMPTSPRLIDSSPFLSRFRKKCQPVPLGMPLAPFARTVDSANQTRVIKKRYKGYPLLVFVGRLRYYKGLQYLVSAMRGIPHAHLLIIGIGPEEEKLRRLTDEFELRDRIHFLGELDDEEVVCHLQAADVFVMPSHLPSEAFGLSMVEAMACGIPVVCCDLKTGVPFVNQDGVTGRVVPPADDEALAKAISGLLSDANTRFKMGEAALRRANEMFSQKAMCTGIAEVYRTALKRRRRKN